MSLNYLRTNNEFEEASRYQVLRVIEEDETYLETFNQIKIPVTSNDTYHIVRHDEVNRLDIIAQRNYSNFKFWWAIALANDFIDPFTVNEGVMLRIPALSTLISVSNKILTR